MHRGIKIALLTSAAIGLSGLSVAIEKPLLASAIAAGPAQKYHVSDYLTQMSEEASRIEEISRSTTQQLSTGSQVAAELQGLIACEISDACVSGTRPGEGKISNALGAVLGGFLSMQSGVQKRNASFGNLLETSRREIEEARIAFNDGDDEAFYEAVAVVHASLSHARGEAGKISFDTSFLTNSGFEKVASLARRFDTVESNPLSTGFNKPIPVFEPMDAYKASVVYSDDILVAHVIATSVCLLPLVLYFILLVSSVTRKDDDDDSSGSFFDQEPVYPSFGNATTVAAE